MRKFVLFAAGLAAAVSVPALASAQASCQEQQHDSRVAGTVVGAGVGALLGSSIAGRGDRGAGAVVGGVGGAVVGNSLGGSSVNCAPTGYYDANGAWVAANGYYDSHGVWVANGPGGYYDSRGVWVAGAPAAPGYGGDASYTGGDAWRGAPHGLDEREAWLRQKIHDGRGDGSLTQEDARQAYQELHAIQQQEAELRGPNGHLRPEDHDRLETQLDQLGNNIRVMRNGGPE